MTEQELKRRKETYLGWIAEWEAAQKALIDEGNYEKADEFARDIADLRSWIGLMTPIPTTWQSGVGYPEKWDYTAEHYVTQIF